MSITASSNTINIYDIPNFNRILNMPKINKNGYLNTANFFSYDNKIYIMSTNHRYSCKNVDPIKIYDLDGTEIKELKDSNENVPLLIHIMIKKYIKNLLSQDLRNIYAPMILKKIQYIKYIKINISHFIEM